ncbi:MAG: hypothetical protein ACJAQ3_001929 [Planctomycetota bacterium]|jgi:hypothetical protein
MNIRFQHLLLVALFAVAHLFVQPLVTTGWCMGADMEGGECCCCPDDAAPTARSGCCGGDEPSDGPEGQPSDSEGYQSGCGCVMTPPAPIAPERNEPASTELGEGLMAVTAGQNPLLSGLWPSLAVRAARPPNRPPRVVSKASPAFTQVFRL